MRGKLCFAALVAVFFVATPALAGWRQTWQPSGAISLRVVRVGERDVLTGIVNPTTGEGRSGNLELRLSGVVVKQFIKPPYYFEIPIEAPVMPDQAIRGKIEGQENPAPVLLTDGLDHVFEAWFTVRDSKGRLVRGKQAAPTVSFRLDPVGVDPAAAAAAIEQRFNQTIESLRAQMAEQKKQYDEEVARLEAEKQAQQERYEKALSEAQAAAKPTDPPARKITVLVDDKDTAGRQIKVSNTDKEVLIEVKGADRYVVLSDDKQYDFAKPDISIKFCKGLATTVRVFAFIGDSATEFNIESKGVG